MACLTVLILDIYRPRTIHSKMFLREKHRNKIYDKKPTGYRQKQLLISIIKPCDLGHKKFIKNILAGKTQLEIVLVKESLSNRRDYMNICN